jgi:nitrate reductase NapAB chaperone NapD
VKEPKKQQIVNVMQAIEQTPPSALATTGAKAKVVVAIETKDAGEAEATMSDIDKIISEVVKDVTVEEDVATAPDKERGIDSGPSGKEDFDLRLLGGQELSEEEKLELKEFAMSCEYQPGALVFGRVDEEILGCIRDRVGANIVGTLSKSVGFLKLETNISCYRR